MYLFYADVFFMLQEIGNVFGLECTGKWFMYPPRRGRAFVVSVGASVLETVLVMYLPFVWFTVVVHVGLIPLAVWLRFRKDVSGVPVKEWVSTYIATLLFYGGTQFVDAIMEHEGILPSLMVAVLLYGLVCVINWRRNESISRCRVCVCYQDVEIEGIGFYDSGNLLYDPIFKNPISLGNTTFLRPILQIYDKPMYPVCFETVSGKGTIETIKVDKLKVFFKGKWHEYPQARIGVQTQWTFNDRQYQILLHSEHK
ncbi:MAG: hypothetical protein E7277_07055 [Lachnospiraceae bacterium]|nr:hypothetical protein [Lachnospiraceae bacterium]